MQAKIARLVKRARYPNQPVAPKAKHSERVIWMLTKTMLLTEVLI
jgi:hypothetical protein